MIKSFLFALVVLVCSVPARAEPAHTPSGQSMMPPATPPSGQTAQQTSLENMTMDQQMAVCNRIEALQKQGKALNTTQQTQKTFCDKMGSTMDTAPAATLER